MRNKFKRKIKKALDKVKTITSADVVAYYRYADMSNNLAAVYLTISSINNTDFSLRLKSDKKESFLYRLDPSCEKTKQELIESNLKSQDISNLEDSLYNLKHTKWEPIKFSYKRTIK